MRRIILPLAAVLAAVASSVSVHADKPARPRSFAYVLQADGVAPARQQALRQLAECGRDWIVIDRAFEGGEDGKWSKDEVTAIRDGQTGRKVLAYLSIGEAEDYRRYWQREWDADRNGRPDAKAPAWLCDENPDWPGNYKVRYWHDAWQDIILAQVDDTVQVGFDGVYLDIVDAFETFEYDPGTKDWIDHRPNPETAKTYREEMIAWVGRIAARARHAKPGFIVVPQNGPQLLDDAGYRATIDAIGVEDLFTNGNRLQTREHTEYALSFLHKAKPAGKPVLVIEYGTKADIVRRSVEGAQENGFLLLVTDRELKTLGQSGISGRSPGNAEAGEHDDTPLARGP